MPHATCQDAPEEQGLALARDGAHNLLDLGLKAHVQHTISLIQNQVGHLTQANLKAARTSSAVQWALTVVW